MNHSTRNRGVVKSHQHPLPERTRHVEEVWPEIDFKLSFWNKIRILEYLRSQVSHSNFVSCFNVCYWNFVYDVTGWLLNKIHCVWHKATGKGRNGSSWLTLLFRASSIPDPLILKLDKITTRTPPSLFNSNKYQKYRIFTVDLIMHPCW